MKSYEELEKEFDDKVKVLQANCPHTNSEWMEDWWAIGHSTGYKVRVCVICNKTLEKVKI